MLSPANILRLARLYAAAEEVALSTVGKRACGNVRIFNRIAAGHGANTRSLEAAESFFREHWPRNAEWPADIVPKPPRARRPRSRSTPAGCAL